MALVSISTDPPEQQLPIIEEYGVTVPMAVDAGSEVCARYDVLKWALPNGEPGHTFILVDREGTVAWIRDYGAPDLPTRTMYVEVSELVEQIRASLTG